LGRTAIGGANTLGRAAIVTVIVVFVVVAVVVVAVVVEVVALMLKNNALPGTVTSGGIPIQKLFWPWGSPLTESSHGVEVVWESN